MNKKIILGTIAIAVVGLIGTVFHASYAGAAGNGGWGMTDEWRNNMHDAIQNNDYNAWKNLRQERFNQMTQTMTQDRFNKMTEMRRLMWDGKYDEARKIADELGIKRMGMGRGGNCNCLMNANN